MADPDEDLVDAIDGSLATLTEGTNLFNGPVRAANDFIPHKAVFVLWAGGASDPINYCDNAATPQWRTYAMAIRVRGDQGAFDGAKDLAVSVVNAIHDVPPTGYVMCRVQGGSPIYIGEDRQGCHEFLIQTILTKQG